MTTRRPRRSKPNHPDLVELAPDLVVNRRRVSSAQLIGLGDKFRLTVRLRGGEVIDRIVEKGAGRKMLEQLTRKSKP